MNKIQTMEQLVEIVTTMVEHREPYIGVWIQLPNLEEPELIINPLVNWADKLEYYMKTYNEELGHDKVEGLRIVGVESFDLDDSEDNLSFGDALVFLKAGFKLARKGWNGKGMFLYYVPPGSYPARTEIAKTIGDFVDYGAYIAMKTAQGNVVPWLASQTDMLADDWEVVE